MANPGVHVYEQSTSVSIPIVADSSIPFVVGAAPSFAAEKPAKYNTPVLVTSWDEAVEKLGFSYDWESYPLCEFMYTYLQLFGCQPAIFCNVLDPQKFQKAAESKTYSVVNHAVSLPFQTLCDDSLQIKNGETALIREEDFSVLYDETANACIVELLSSGSAYDAVSLTVESSVIQPESIAMADIVDGLNQVDACMNAVGKIPGLICAPGWSHNPVIAALMASKAEGINGLFRAKALIDIDCGPDGVHEYSDLIAYKNQNNLVDENQIVCWPMAKLGDYKFHLSSQLAGLIASVDANNGGCPYESPSNKNFQIDGTCLEDGTEVNLTFEQCNIIASYGIVTALNFMSTGWTCRNNYTACYPGNTDVKDIMIPVSRMFDWVANTLIQTFWSNLDKPMKRRFADNILDTCNIWLNGLTGSGYLHGGRAELLASENPDTNLLDGIVHFHIYLTPPSPAQEIDFTLEYDIDYLKAAFE